jgi:heat shock protein HslJ
VRLEQSRSDDSTHANGGIAAIIQGMPGKRSKAIVLVLAVAFLIAASPARAGDDEALFGKRYHSVSVTKDGEPLALVEGTKLRVGFIRGKVDSASWHAGCNAYGAHIAIVKDVIDVDPKSMISTAMECFGDGLARQDNFFAHFFKGDPTWSASGRDLTLGTERVTVELRKRAK